MNETINVDNFRAIAIFGDTDSGKTALAYKLLEGSKKPIFFVRHPNPDSIKPFGYENLLGLDALSSMENCVVYWDEPQLYCSTSEYKRDILLTKVLSLARQRGITLIISSSDTRTFSKRVEAYFDLWLIKDCDYSMTKQRSKLRHIISENAFIMPEEVRLDKNQFLAYTRKEPQINGKHSFELIEKWSEELSKPYSLTITSQKLIENSQNCNKTQLNTEIKK